MLANNLTLDDASGDDVVFNLVSQGVDGNRRVDTASVPGAARTLNIRHTQTGNAANGYVDRHLVQIVHDVATSEGTKTITVNFTVNVPRSSLVAQSLVFDDIAFVVDLITDGALVNPMTTTTLSALLRGES